MVGFLLCNIPFSDFKLIADKLGWTGLQCHTAAIEDSVTFETRLWGRARQLPAPLETNSSTVSVELKSRIGEEQLE